MVPCGHVALISQEPVLISDIKPRQEWGRQAVCGLGRTGSLTQASMPVSWRRPSELPQPRGQGARQANSPLHHLSITPEEPGGCLLPACLVIKDVPAIKPARTWTRGWRAGVYSGDGFYMMGISPGQCRWPDDGAVPPQDPFPPEQMFVFWGMSSLGFDILSFFFNCTAICEYCCQYRILQNLAPLHY